MAQHTRRKPRSSRIVGWIALTVLLLIPLLGVSSAPASAQDATCQGQIVSGSCVVDLGPPVCVAPAVFDGSESCVTTVEAEQSPPTCPAGSLGEPGGCYVLVAKDQAGEPFCTEGALIGADCVITGEPPVSECPAGFAADAALGGLCARFEPAEQSPSTCPAGSLGEPGGCYILVAKGPAGPPFCLEGDLIGDNCVLVGEPPVNGPATCPVSATVILDGNRCFTLVAPTEDGCPAGTTPAANGVDCERPVDLRPGALMCETGFGLNDGQCLRYTTPGFPPAQCPSGSVEDNNGDCRKPVADAAGGYFCSDPQAALNGTSCVFTTGFFLTCAAGFGLLNGQCIRYETPVVPPAQCPPGSVEDNNGDCRKPVADVPPQLVCPAGAALTNGVCQTSAAAVCVDGVLTNGSCIETTPLGVFCKGQLVTINMRTGDSGMGTNGNDVILGTAGADTINARGGDDLICAGGGDDNIHGGSGNDDIYGQGGADNIRGGTGNDTIRSGGGDDTVRGGSGDDDIRGGSGNDDLRGGSNTDVLRGGTGDDALRGGSGSNDRCIGNSGTDTAARSCELVSSTP